MKKYELKYTKGEEGVFRMSTVESPATKTTLVMFDDEQKLLQFADDEKKVIYSVAMRPNMLIPRKDINGEPAMVFYTEETVNDLQQNFFKNNSHNGATINHDGETRSDMYAFESWIVSDPEKDKATSLGLDVKKGDWVLAQKIDNDSVWQDIKSGKLQGFSIEAYLEPVLINKEIEMTKEEVDARIKRVMMESNLGKEYDVDGTKYFIDKLEAGGIVTDGEGVAVPNLEITVEEIEIKTDENGVIKEVETEMEGEDVSELQKVIDDQAVEINDLKAEIVKLQEARVEMRSEIAAAKKVVMEMSITPNPAPQKALHEMSALEKYRASKQ